MACYKDRKITVRFTHEQYLRMMDAIEEMPSWECNTPSEYLRRLVTLELGRLEVERIKQEEAQKEPAKKASTFSIPRRSKVKAAS